MTDTTAPAAIYARISQDREGRELGVTRQEQDCRALAARLGLPAVRVFVENDTGASSKSRKPRPQFEALVRAAERGEVGTVLAYSTSRLTRRPMEHERLLALAERHGTRFAYVQSPSFDLGTAAGRQVARMLAAADAAAAETTSELVARSARQRAERGDNHGGRRAYGFRGTQQVPGEVQVIRAMAEAVLTGVSLRSLCADLNRRGVPTVTGTPWSGRTVKDVLTAERMRGNTVHNGVVVGHLPGAPVLTEETWMALQARFEANTPSVAGRPPSWLLSGIGRCQCGALLDAGPRAAYRCRVLRSGPGGGGHVRRNRDHLDQFVAELVIERLSQPGIVERLTPAAPGVDVPALTRKANRLRATKTRLAELLGAGELDAADFTAAKRRNDADLAAAEAELAAAAAQSPAATLAAAADGVRAAWDRAPLGVRREIVAELLTVTVLPTERRGAGFDPARVEITWR